MTNNDDPGVFYGQRARLHIDPESSPPEVADGGLWFDAETDRMMARVNGSDVEIASHHDQRLAMINGVSDEEALASIFARLNLWGDVEAARLAKAVIRGLTKRGYRQLRAGEFVQLQAVGLRVIQAPETPGFVHPDDFHYVDTLRAIVDRPVHFSLDLNVQKLDLARETKTVDRMWTPLARDEGAYDVISQHNEVVSALVTEDIVFNTTRFDLGVDVAQVSKNDDDA
jgi:hypothetical protein